jgi:hypothetical protein
MVMQTRNSSTYRNRNSYNCSQQNIDEHRTFKTSKNFQQRWTLDFQKAVKLSVEMPMGLQKNSLKLSAEMEMGLMTIASQVRRSSKKGTAILTEIEIPTIVHSKAEMNIGLSKPSKTFSRDGHWTLEKQ